MEDVEFLSYGVEALRAKVASDFHRGQTIHLSEEPEVVLFPKNRKLIMVSPLTR